MERETEKLMLSLRLSLNDIFYYNYGIVVVAVVVTMHYAMAACFGCREERRKEVTINEEKKIKEKTRFCTDAFPSCQISDG